MDDDNINEFETLKSIYLVPVGKKKNIEKFVRQLNNCNKYPDIKYICSQINVPLAVKAFDLSQELNMEIEVSTSVEKALCLTLAHGYDEENFIALIQTKSSITMMTISINEDCDPEKTLCSWIKSRLQSESDDILPYHKIIKKTLTPIDIVGDNEEILIYSSTVDHK